MHYYRKHIADFNNATRHLTRQERSIYLDLLELQYDLEEPIPNDLDWICRRILATKVSERTDVERTLNEFFDQREEGWSNGRCEGEIAAYQSKQMKAIEAGKLSGISRRRNKKPRKQGAPRGEGTDVQHPLNERSADVELTNNHKPITNNHKPVTNKGRFAPPSTQEVEQYMIEKGVQNAGQEAENFIAYYESQGWKKANGQKVVRWKGCVITWKKSRGKSNGNYQSQSDRLEESFKNAGFSPEGETHDGDFEVID